jgi:hypothetical protein
VIDRLLDVRAKKARRWRGSLGSGTLGFVSARFEFKVQDCWVGVYWNRGHVVTDVYVCLLPMLPLHIAWPREWWR